MIQLSDDLRHAFSDENNYSESKWFSFHDLRRDIWISCRIGLEPNRQSANRWMVVAINGKVIFKDLALNLPLPSSNWDDMEVAGFRIQTLEPMKKYQLSFHAPNLQWKICWKALTPVFDYEDCFAPLPPSLGSKHYEQSGQVQGNLLCEAGNYAIECYGHRDHSWGVRHWEGFRSWIAFMAPFGKKSFLHVERFDEQQSGQTCHGFLYHQGRNVPLKRAEIDLDFSNKGAFPSSFRMSIEDILGNLIPVHGQLQLTTPLAFGRCVVGESYGTFTVEGNTKTGIIEYGFTA